MSYHSRRYTAERAEHEYDIRRAEPRLSDLPASQQIALLKLVGYAEGLVRGGCLGELVEAGLREQLAEARAAFGVFNREGVDA
jgi:hypothetical protein